MEKKRKNMSHWLTLWYSIKNIISSLRQRIISNCGKSISKVAFELSRLMLKKKYYLILETYIIINIFVLFFDKKFNTLSYFIYIKRYSILFTFVYLQIKINRIHLIILLYTLKATKVFLYLFISVF